LVPALANACVRFLEQSLTARNACLLLSQARLFSEPALIQRAWEVIDAQAEMALTSEAFADIDFDTLMSILSRETLNCKETVVFTAANSWAQADCKKKDLDPCEPENRKSVLGKAIYKIRFPAMSIADFADVVAMSGMLTIQETNDIFLYFTAKEKPPLHYDSKARRGLSTQFCPRFVFIFLTAILHRGLWKAVTHLLPNTYGPRTLCPPLLVPLDKRSPTNSVPMEK
jgi:BTB/POZ domain-containing protein 3/6